MKPLPPAPPTPEDRDVILFRIDVGNPYMGMRLDRTARDSDRCDAALMRKLGHSARVLGRPAVRVWVLAVDLLEKGLPE